MLRLALKEPVGYQEQHDHRRGLFSLACWVCAASLLQGGVKLKAEKTEKGALLLSGWVLQ